MQLPRESRLHNPTANYIQLLGCLGLLIPGPVTRSSRLTDDKQDDNHPDRHQSATGEGGPCRTAEHRQGQQLPCTTMTRDCFTPKSYPLYSSPHC